MTWGALYFYYQCPKCKKLYKYSLVELAEYGNEFGKCPNCKEDGVLIKEGAVTEDDLLYEEV